MEFVITEQEDRTWLFEKGNISVIVEGFEKQEQDHRILNPLKAIGYFIVDGNIFGLSNELDNCETVEVFYSKIQKQFIFFDQSKTTETFFNKYAFDNNADGSRSVTFLNRKDIQSELKYTPAEGWSLDGKVLKKQPSSVGDVLRLYMVKSGGQMLEGKDQKEGY